MTALLANLFTDAGDTFTTRTSHTGLLWGLEGIAWSPEYLPAAAEALLNLAEIDPGGRLANRPSKSLVDIFRAWYPQTSALVDRRLAVLRILANRHPVATRSLLIALLPEHMGTATDTHAPRFRQWRVSPTAVPTQEFWQAVEGVLAILLEMAETQPDLWPGLTERIPDLSGPQRENVYSRLEALSESETVDRGLRDRVWQVIGDLARQHRAFADARWALGEADLVRIEEITALFAPVDLVEKSKWLFESQVPNTGSRRTQDFDVYEAEVDELRSEAIRSIVAREGPDGIHRLIDATPESFAIGRTLSNVWEDAPEEAILADIDSPDPKRAGAAMGFAIRRVERQGLQWVDDTLPRLTGRPTSQARVLRASREFEQVWQRLEDLDQDVKDAYWREFVPYGLGTDQPLISEIASRLLANGRPGAAADLLHLYVGRTESPIDPLLVAGALEAAVDANAPEIRRLASYGIQLLLDYLRSSELDEVRLGILEWRVFPALGYGAQSPVLERRLARDPEFFVQILSMVYKRTDGSTDSRPNPEVTQNAFHLLHAWQTVPGSVKRGGAIDQDQLRQWLVEARRLLREADRREIGLQHVGQVFAHAREDADGSWPALAVRDAIEDLASSEVDAGFVNECYNKRGVTTRGLADGGRQEYALADQYSRLASLVLDGWSRTARLLRSISEGYRAQGRMEDEEAQRIREGLDR